MHLPATFMPKARFDHDKHSTFKCLDCHESVPKSKSSNDIAIPDITSCRLCHAGSVPAASRIVSNCVACHGFHDVGHPPWNKGVALISGEAPRAAAMPTSPAKDKAP